MKLKNIKQFILNPVARFSILNSRGFYRNLSDEAFLKKAFKIRMGKELNLENPSTFNEKLQWLKLNVRNSGYTDMVDKQKAKEIVAAKIGEDYIIPTIGIWKKFEEIDFEQLPQRFVLKCAHDSGGLIICKDKAKLNIEGAEKKINRCMKRNYYWNGREWPYKNVKPCIIAEEFVEDKKYQVLPVYKIMCFHGEPRIIQTIQNDKQVNESIDYFDTDWNLLQLRQGFPNSKNPYKKPEKLQEMLKIARIFSKGHPFLRVDLYVANEEIKFSEFTFYSDNGFVPFEPSSWDEKLGSWINLPESKVQS